MLRRVIGITSISLWAGLVLVISVSTLKAEVEEIFQNLPEGWIIEKSVTVPSDQTLAFGRKLGARISKLTNTYLSIDGKPLQINVVHCNTERGAERAFEAIIKEHENRTIETAVCNKIVVEFAKCDDVELIKRARVGLGFAPYQLDSIASKLIKNIPDNWKVEKSFIASQEQVSEIIEKLGGQIRNISNTVFSIDAIEGKQFQVNILECDTPRTARRIYKSILQTKNDPAFCLTHRNMVVEFIGDDVELARKAPSELGLRPKARGVTRRIDDLDINAKVAKLDFKTATLNRVIGIFGEPVEYKGDNNQTFTKEKLPPTYFLKYPNGFSMAMSNGRVLWLMHTQPGYIWQGKLGVGDPLEKVLEVVGQPKKIVTGEQRGNEDGVLYKDIDGVQGRCYYVHDSKGVQFYFKDSKVSGIFVTGNDHSALTSARTEVEGPTGTTSEPTVVEALAGDFIEMLAEGNFPKATENFDANMKSKLPAENLQQIWNSIIAQTGPFVEQLSVRNENVAPYEVVFVNCRFERGVLDAKVVYNADRQVSGLFFIPSQIPAPEKSHGSTGLNAFTEKQVQVGDGQLPLPGTLTLPKGDGPFPAVVLVHGSGPHDRDETIGPNKPFRDVAHGLAVKGVAVFRYDKRARAFPVQTAAIINSLTVKEEVIDDVIAAVALLRDTNQINADRIFVLGHSLGGFVIPRIGKLDLKIAGFIIMAASARPLEDVVVEQFTYIFSLDGEITDTEKASLDKLKTQAARVKDPQLSTTTPAADLPLNIPAAYWLDLRGYQPAEMAKELSHPILILQGGRDYQVTNADFQIWKKALSSKSNVEFKFCEKLNHLFMEGQGKSTPAEYQIPGHVAQTVIEDITDWIKKH